MVTITPHTTRATGTVLTASIYNTDHQNHVTNATNIDAVAVYRDQSNNFSTGTTQTLQGTSVLRIETTGDASLVSTLHGFQIGASSGINLIADNEEIAVRNNGVAHTLRLNPDGGNVTIGDATSTVTISGTFAFGGALTGSGLTLTSTDAGAGAGPDLVLYRNSASPAASDDLGRIVWDGKDSVGNQETYARLSVDLDDPTSASEDASFLFQTKTAGAFVTWSMDGLTGGGVRINPNDNAANAFDIDSNGNATINGTLAAEATTITGTLSVTSTATFDSHVQLQDAASHLIFSAADTDTYMDYVSSGTFRVVCNNDEILRFSDNTVGGGGILIGKTVSDGGDTVGVELEQDGTIDACVNGSAVLKLNRLTNDGVLANFEQAGVNEGSIEVTGTTISYNAFLGSHWSQLADGSRPDIPIGTICDSISQLCSWPKDDEKGRKNNRLPRFKISDIDASKAVYGIFLKWDNDDLETNDATIASIGAGWVRIRLGEDVQVGDLICSAGNGCGRVQDDDVFRASTVAKVTSTEVVEIYEDGSFRVPATLHCG